MESLDFINRVVALTNLERSKFGLAPLTFDSQLSRAAQNHSVDMAHNDYFAHNSLNGSTPRDRVRAAGYQDWTSAENIAAGHTTPEAVVQGWMNSPGHRANILAPDLQNIGVGYYFLATDMGKVNYQHYWTQNFGTRFPSGSYALGIDSAETLQGGQGNDTLYGLGGDDVIIANAGDDIVFGNMGNDTLYGSAGKDTIYGGKGNDLIFGEQENDVLFGNIGNDILYGNIGSDTLYGGQDNDFLYGGQDGDILLGDLGNDVLVGDSGFDTLTGGGGNDTFVLKSSKGTDIITDFQGGIDVIGLSGGLTFANLTINQGTGNNVANTLITSNGELLAVLTGIQAGTLTNANFQSI